MSRECPECQEEYDYYNHRPEEEGEPYVEEQEVKNMNKEIGKCPVCKDLLFEGDLLEVPCHVIRKTNIIGKLMGEGQRDFIVCRKCNSIIAGGPT